MNTAISENVIDTMVKPISRAPLSAASNGRIPPSTWRTMFSSMTMASSDLNEHGDQRERDRHDGEADLARALERRLERPHPAFDVAHDVLKHDDGVVRSE